MFTKTSAKEDAEEAVITKIKNEILTSETFSVIADKMRPKNLQTQRIALTKKLLTNKSNLQKIEKRVLIFIS